MKLNNKSISSLLESCPIDFDSTLSKLKAYNKEKFCDLEPETNSIINDISSFNQEQLSFIITEYAAFSQ